MSHDIPKNADCIFLKYFLQKANNKETSILFTLVLAIDKKIYETLFLNSEMSPYPCIILFVPFIVSK